MGNKLSFKFNCFGGADEGDAWKAQGKAGDVNPVYKLINLAKEGVLITIYEEEGPEALQEYVRKHVEPMQYNHGKGHMLTKAEYLRWKSKNEAMNAVSIKISIQSSKLQVFSGKMVLVRFICVFQKFPMLIVFNLENSNLTGAISYP